MLKCKKLVIWAPYWGVVPTLACMFLGLYTAVAVGILFQEHAAAMTMHESRGVWWTAAPLAAIAAFVAWHLIWLPSQADDLRFFPDQRRIFVRYGALGRTRVHDVACVKSVEIVELERRSRGGKYKVWVVAFHAGDERVQLRTQLAKERAEAIARQIADWCDLEFQGNA